MGLFGSEIRIAIFYLNLEIFRILVHCILKYLILFQNSNILSAVLCLIKELDGPSLEVAEMAIRCRMEELDD